ncbi:radical SAM protein, partial [Desulfocurvibacter africanus]
AEVEASRGCPFGCVFCAREYFRGVYRKRPMATVLAEIDGLLSRGVEYVYFIDELFLADRPLLSELAARGLKFGIQTRIDIWKPRDLELLGRAGCVSVEAGLECLTPDVRALLGKRSAMSTEQMVERLVMAKSNIPFVQANLVDVGCESPDFVAEWRDRLHSRGIWANDPVPIFPYPGSNIYRRKWGEPDDLAWERALQDYHAGVTRLSELQDAWSMPAAVGS